ncbi:hypothetical protein ACHQM5_000642 [Ranunculus cassubicifolius]
MSTETPSKAKVAVRLVTLNKGLKLAESWVKNMSGSASDEPDEVIFEGRQPGLGLGARPIHQPRMANSSDPVERRLLAKLNAQKKSALAKSVEENTPAEGNGGAGEDEDSDDDLESRSKSFSKKRAIPTASLKSNKKKK